MFWWCRPDSPKPDSPNLEKVHCMSKCSCFVEKIVPRVFNYILVRSFCYCNSEQSQHS